MEKYIIVSFFGSLGAQQIGGDSFDSEKEAADAIKILKAERPKLANTALSVVKIYV